MNRSTTPTVAPRPRALVVMATIAALATVALVSPPAAGAAVGTPTTYLDHTYASTVAPPTADKPQSKLWWHDGSWWGLLLEQGGTRTMVHELIDDHTWRNTGTVVDSRANSTGDALWDNATGKLFVASRVTGDNLQVTRLSYDGAGRTWRVDSGFPLSVNSGGGSESASIDRDSTGRLWVTYTRGSKIWVAVSDTNGGNWTAGFLPSVIDTSIAADDLSAVIAFGTSIGIMWSDQESNVFRFAIHDDGAPLDQWRLETVPQSEIGSSDDHINLKQLVGDPQGRIFAAVKTSAGDVETDPQSSPLVGVLTRTPGAGGVGTWKFASAGTVADDHSRPLIMIDASNQQLYFFATAPVSGGDVFYKKAPLSNVTFGPGRGTPFVDAAPVVNNASGAKDPVTVESGLVILAVAHGKKQYVHAEMQLGAGGGPTGGGGGGDTTPPTAATSPVNGATGVAVAANVTATFDEAVTGVSGTSFALTPSTGGTAVPATVSYNATSRVATLNPSADLAAGTAYTATLTQYIRDASGNALAPVSWTFTTAGTSGGTGAPTATVSPADGSTGFGTTANISATFSEPVKAVSKTTFVLKNADTGAAVTAGVNYNATTRVATLNPGATLAANTRYTATLIGGTTAIRDATNVPLATTSWTFTTAATGGGGTGDTKAPTITYRAPAVNATGVYPTANVAVTFSEPVVGVDAATFTLTGPDGQTVAAAVTSTDGRKWLLDPTASLAARTRYTVTVTGGPTAIRDAAGNPLATSSWSFTTR